MQGCLNVVLIQDFSIVQQVHIYCCNLCNILNTYQSHIITSIKEHKDLSLTAY